MAAIQVHITRPRLQKATLVSRPQKLAPSQQKVGRNTSAATTNNGKWNPSRANAIAMSRGASNSTRRRLHRGLDHFVECS